ncbi:Hypothetical protein FKW44_023772 [Caligus rogercresseyi]|uniref:Uncharacterized protein n=1 Tax=Caligus rogercresseyi TaxID=217165 RepID=A0A7T8GPG7_CALRO|nr:Hypothetical protein FKW44_023772 [Caligus rogercresseyi]
MLFARRSPSKHEEQSLCGPICGNGSNGTLQRWEGDFIRQGKVGGWRDVIHQRCWTE